MRDAHITTAPQSKQDRIPYKQSRPRQSCRQALSPTLIFVQVANLCF